MQQRWRQGEKFSESKAVIDENTFCYTDERTWWRKSLFYGHDNGLVELALETRVRIVAHHQEPTNQTSGGIACTYEYFVPVVENAKKSQWRQCKPGFPADVLPKRTDLNHCYPLNGQKTIEWPIFYTTAFQSSLLKMRWFRSLNFRAYQMAVPCTLPELSVLKKYLGSGNYSWLKVPGIVNYQRLHYFWRLGTTDHCSIELLRLESGYHWWFHLKWQ